jgi:hypothetical protein
MKIILFFIIIIALVSTQNPELEICIQDKCPDQYASCKAASGCEDLLWKC